MSRFIVLSLLFANLLVAAQAFAQVPPALGDRPQNPEAQRILETACTVSDDDDEEEDNPRVGEEWDEEYAQRRAYNELMPQYFAAAPLERDAEVLVPVEGVTLSQIADTWGAARSEGRSHEGVDIFADEGTPIYAATPGYVYRIGQNPYGGNTVTVIGGAGVRYYYAHMSGFAEDLQEGQYVTTDTLIGYVGNTGNAATTPPHLHLGIYGGSYESCGWDAENPYGLLVDRAW